MKTPLWRYLTPGGLMAAPTPPPEVSMYTGALPVYIDLQAYQDMMAAPNAGIINDGRIISPNTLSL